MNEYTTQPRVCDGLYGLFRSILMMLLEIFLNHCCSCYYVSTLGLQFLSFKLERVQ